MRKKYMVRLAAKERQVLGEVVKKLKGSSQKVLRAQILLKADAASPVWTDQKIAEAFGCRRQTMENVRQRAVTEGFEATLERQGPRGTGASACFRLPRRCPKVLGYRTIHGQS